MLCLAVTGGIATGKSLFCRQPLELVPGAVLFDADACVAELLADPGVREESLPPSGRGRWPPTAARIGRVLRELVFADEAARRQLEGILHPRVRRECLARRAKRLHSAASPLFVADIPLLFEHGADFGHQWTVVVATSPATQARRLQSRSGFDDAMVRSILAAQLPITEKIRRADRVVWNEGPPDRVGPPSPLAPFIPDSPHERHPRSSLRPRPPPKTPRSRPRRPS